MKKYQLTEEEYKRILDFKRDLHMHPELSRKEVRTTAKIRAFLETLPDFSILPLETETGTGIAAQICGEQGKEKSPEIMLRADIDALPQTEEYESPWKSQVPGVMHACGHDFHTASLLGAALLLQRAKEDGLLKNTVDLVFQPAEEGTTGAGVMIKAGLFDPIHPDFCFGIHNWPSVQTGRIVCHQGPLMSGKRNFEIRIHGAGGHGSMPHLNIDPIVCAAAVIQSLQTVVSRNTDPLDSVILTVNRIEGGGPMNLVAEQVTMLASVRSLSDPALDRAIERVGTIVEKTAEAYECRGEIIWSDRIPAVWNSPEMTAQAKRCAAATGCRVVDAPPSLAT
jgi:hippurate hydrolase